MGRPLTRGMHIVKFYTVNNIWSCVLSQKENRKYNSSIFSKIYQSKKLSLLHFAEFEDKVIKIKN